MHSRGRSRFVAAVGALLVGFLVTAVPAHAVAASETPSFTFTIDPSWSASDRATLASWIAPGSPEMTALAQVAGPPGQSAALNIVYDPAGAHAGEFAGDAIYLSFLDLAVFMHELNHAVHGPWIIPNSVWEEGMARAAEVAEMNRLDAQGVPEADGYFDLHHRYSYDQYDRANNTSDVGVSGGNIWGLGDPALALLRYEQAGYAFGKILIESPSALVQFNARLFAQPNGSLDASVLESMLGAVRDRVEDAPFATWYDRQQIFNASPPAGCRMFQRANQYTVDLFERSPDGVESPQSNVDVSLHVYRADGSLLWSGSDVTGSFGFAAFAPGLGSYAGRIEVVASATAPCGDVTSRVYRQSGLERGVFGVVENVTSGSVTLSSPNGAFANVTVPVQNGAFAAPGLASVVGTIHAQFAGGGMSAAATFTKDASPYFVGLRAAMTEPDSPRIGTATRSNSAAYIAFSAPVNNGGSAITGYVATCTSSNGGVARSASSSAGPIVVAGLTNGRTYTCNTVATNAIGTSLPSGASNAFTPAPVPGAPVSVSAFPFGNGVAKVVWHAPVNGGGSAIKGYVVRPYLGGVAQPTRTFNGAGTSQLLSGLQNGKSYQYTIAAVNGAGTGIFSSKTAAMTAGAPGQPGKPTAVKVASGSLKLTFAAPANNGASITQYTASCTSANGGLAKTKAGAASPVTVTGLSAGKTYTCTVIATNSRGTGPRSAAAPGVTA